MSDFERDEFEPIEDQLRRARPELTPLELDRVKRGVAAKSAGQGGRGMSFRSRLVAGLLALGLVGAGGGAVLAASGGSSSNGSSANSQYCPDSSPGAGKPKHQGGGNKCGQPDDGGNGGGQGNGGGNGNGNGNGNGQGNGNGNGNGQGNGGGNGNGNGGGNGGGGGGKGK
jgi:hypothetical protein